jgi:spermidine synthase
MKALEVVRKTRDLKANLWLSFSILLTGGAGLIYEYLLSTTSSYIMGSSIEQFSITIALMLLSMGTAGYIQKKISDNHLVEKFIFIEAFLSLLGSLSVIITYSAFAYLENYEIIYYLTASLIGFLIGLEIPIVLRINEKYTNGLSENLSFIYSADYVGAFLGALFWVFVMLKFFSLIQIAFITGAVNLLVAFLTYLYFKEFIDRNYRKLFLAVISFTLLVDLSGLTFQKKLEKFLQKPLYNQPCLLYTSPSPRD